jgi:uncharacterized protein
MTYEDLYSVDGDDVVVALHVQPGAGRTEVVGRHGAALKVKVAAPPVDGRANDAVCKLLADLVGVPPSSAELIAGASSRTKRVRLRGVEAATLEAVLEPLLRDGGVIGAGRGGRGGRGRRGR